MSFLTSIVRVHDSGVVEHDVHASPLVDAVNESLDVVLLANIALGSLDLADHLGSLLLCLGEGLLERGLRDIGHNNRSTLAEEENDSLKANATGSTGDDGVLAFQAESRHCDSGLS